MAKTGIAILAAVLLTAGAASAVSPADKCESAKLKEAGKYGFCRLKAAAKAVKAGGLPDYSKCEAKLASKWPAIESAGGGMCPSNGDQAAVQAFVVQHAADLAAALDGGTLPSCPPAPLCGNGAIDGGEDCDLGTLAGATCASQGFASGVLSCNSGCAFDTGGCWNARFVDNADGTITDNQNGLTWEKKTELGAGSNFANPHDADNTYQWAGTCSVTTSKYCQPTSAAAALCAANAEGGTTGCAECTGGDGTCNAATTVWTWAADLNTAAFAGHNDWRVPTRHELDGIFDLTAAPSVDVAFHGASCGFACTDLANPACSCTRADVHWSATTASSPSFAWLADFAGGYISSDLRTYGYFVRAVRGGS